MHAGQPFPIPIQPLEDEWITSPVPTDDPWGARQRRQQLVQKLWNTGAITSIEVCHAFLQTPREFFVNPDQHMLAYEDAALAIDCGQTISQPTVTAIMLENLRINPCDCILEIGTGSGYNTALLARLCRRVLSLERIRRLALLAEQRLDALGITNTSVRFDDGYRPLSGNQEFDKIIITAVATGPPSSLLERLRVGGIMIFPYGNDREQHLMCLHKDSSGIKTQQLCPVSFVPMLPGTCER